MKQLGWFFAQRRRELQLGLGDCARLLGYRGKGVVGACNKLKAFEEFGRPLNDLAWRYAALLQVDRHTVDTWVTKAERIAAAAWLVDLRRPQKRQAIVRIIPAVYLVHAIPESMDDQAAIEFARCLASRQGRKVCLVLSSIVQLWISEVGELDGFTESGSNSSPLHPPGIYMVGDEQHDSKGHAR